MHGVDTAQQIWHQLTFQHAKKNQQAERDSALPTDADNKQKLGLRADIEPVLQPGLTLELHKLLLLHKAQIQLEQITYVPTSIQEDK